MGINEKIRVVPRFIVALVILGFIFSRIPLSDVIHVLTAAGLPYVLASCAASFLSLPFQAYLLKFLAAKHALSISAFRALEINLRSVFYGLFLPGGNLTSGAIRAYQLSGQGSDPERKTTAAVSCIVFDRITNQYSGI